MNHAPIRSPLLVATLCADSYTLEGYLDADDPLPALVEEQGNNPWYSGSALHILPVGSSDAIPKERLRKMIEGDVARLKSEPAWRRAVLVVEESR